MRFRLPGRSCKNLTGFGTAPPGTGNRCTRPLLPPIPLCRTCRLRRESTNTPNRPGNPVDGSGTPSNEMLSMELRLRLPSSWCRPMNLITLAWPAGSQQAPASVLEAWIQGFIAPGMGELRADKTGSRANELLGRWTAGHEKVPLGGPVSLGDGKSPLRIHHGRWRPGRKNGVRPPPVSAASPAGPTPPSAPSGGTRASGHPTPPR